MDISWWVTHSLDKLFPESGRPVGASARIRLRAARNETEDAQIAIRIPKGVEIARASFRLSDLTGPRRRRMPAKQLSAQWVWYTYVLNNPGNLSDAASRDPSTYLRKAPAFFPDAFLESKEIRIRDEWTQPLWISVRVPPRTVPGEYTGAIGISLLENGGAQHRIEAPIALTVLPFTLPAKPTLRHTEWFYPEVFAEYYRVAPWSEAHWEWIEKAAADMAKHRQDMILTPFFSLVRVIRKASGKCRYDFDRLDRWVRTFRKAGIESIEGSHVAGRPGGWTSEFAWGRFPLWDEDGREIGTSREKMNDEQFEPCMEAFLKAVHAHLRRRGWSRRYVQHIADEPVEQNAASWRNLAGKVRKWLPNVPIIDAVMSGGLEDYVDIRVPQIQECAPGAAAQTKGELWSYVCLAPQGQYPNRFLDYPSIRNRILFWLSWSLGLKGFLHWGYAYWRCWSSAMPEVDLSPWLDATAGTIYCADRTPLPAGDPHVVYPGRKSICSSIRWEVVRKGMEDYEYPRLLEQAVLRARGNRKGNPAVLAAKRLLSRVRDEIARDPLAYTRDEQLLLATREEAGELLARLLPEAGSARRSLSSRRRE